MWNRIQIIIACLIMIAFVSAIVNFNYQAYLYREAVEEHNMIHCSSKREVRDGFDRMRATRIDPTIDFSEKQVLIRLHRERINIALTHGLTARKFFIDNEIEEPDCE